MRAEGGAREEILARVRAANGGADDAGLAAAGEWAAIPRAYRRSRGMSRDAVLELLEDRLRDYDAHIFRTSRAGIAEVIARRLLDRKGRRMIVPHGFPQEMLPEGFAFTTDEGLSAIALDDFDGVVTTATLAIAETGTLVLQNVAGQGRRATSLIPDYHLCVLSTEVVVLSVPEAMERLASTATLPTTFISGPSATSDIEMTRIKGVHGPRFLEVVLYEEDGGLR